jgi:3D (Asp-Asp-Asp) domain-containing protein
MFSIGLDALMYLWLIAIGARPIPVQATSYCGCAVCCAKNSTEVGGHGLTKSGIKPLEGWTLASLQIRRGTIVILPSSPGIFGDGRHMVHDRGGPTREDIAAVGVRAGIDIFVRTHEEARRYGRRTIQCWVLERGR